MFIDWLIWLMDPDIQLVILNENVLNVKKKKKQGSIYAS